MKKILQFTLFMFFVSLVFLSGKTYAQEANCPLGQIQQNGVCVVDNNSSTVSNSSTSSSNLIPCGTEVYPKGDKDEKGNDRGGTIKNPCNFTSLMTLINNVIDFVFKKLALPIAAIMFAYAGFLLVTAQGGEAKTKAKNIFTNTVIGLVLAAAAWLIVKTLLIITGYKPEYMDIFFK